MHSPETRIDEIVDGIYRIASWSPDYGITFNQFLIDDERPALIHTGTYPLYDNVHAAIGEVLDPAKLEFVALLHFESDECGGMDRFLETPHVHHWDSMMLYEETTGSVFPADLYLQPGEQPPIVDQDLGAEMCGVYRSVGIFAHEQPVRQVVDRIEALDPSWMLAMHGGTLTREAIPRYTRALRERPFAYEGTLLGREVVTQPVR